MPSNNKSKSILTSAMIAMGMVKRKKTQKEQVESLLSKVTALREDVVCGKKLVASKEEQAKLQEMSDMLMGAIIMLNKPPSDFLSKVIDKPVTNLDKATAKIFKDKNIEKPITNFAAAELIFKQTKISADSILTLKKKKKTII